MNSELASLKDAEALAIKQQADAAAQAQTDAQKKQQSFNNKFQSLYQQRLDSDKLNQQEQMNNQAAIAQASYEANRASNDLSSLINQGTPKSNDKTSSDASSSVAKAAEAFYLCQKACEVQPEQCGNASFYPTEKAGTAQ